MLSNKTIKKMMLEVENKIPTISQTLGGYSSVAKVVGCINAIICIIGGICILASDINEYMNLSYLGWSLIIGGLIFCLEWFIFATLLKGLSVTVENSFRSAEYNKILLENLLTENTSEVENKKISSDDDLPEL